MDNPAFQPDDRIFIESTYDAPAVECRYVPGSQSLGIFYIGGFGSDPWNPVADMFAEHARERDLSFVGFSYSGDRTYERADDGLHLKLENFTIGRWHRDVETVFQHARENLGIDSFVLFASSFGANLGVKLVRQHPEDVIHGSLLVAPAFDIDEHLLPMLLMAFPDKAESLKQEGRFSLDLPPSHQGAPFTHAYITNEVIADAAKHRTFSTDEPVRVLSPLAAIHSDDDPLVPFFLAESHITGRITCPSGVPGFHPTSGARHNYERTEDIGLVQTHFENLLQSVEAQRPVGYPRLDRGFSQAAASA